MLPKKDRLNLKKEFSLLAAGRRLENDLVKMFVKIQGDGWPRIGIALSGETFKKAAERNRARRATAQALESLYPTLCHGANIVLLPKKKVLESEEEEIRSGLKTLFTKAKVIKDEKDSNSVN